MDRGSNVASIARVEMLAEISSHAAPLLKSLHDRGIFKPDGDVVGDVFVPNNRLLAFVMLMGEAGVDSDDDEAVTALRESCGRKGPNGRRAKLTNRGYRVGAALNRDGGHAEPAPLSDTYLRELADGLKLPDHVRQQLVSLNRHAGEAITVPFDSVEVAEVVRQRQAGGYPAAERRNLADDPPQTRETVDRPAVREWVAAELTRAARRPIVLSGPSGTGKTALITRLLDRQTDRPPQIGVWIHANSRAAILDGFARAANEIQRAIKQVPTRTRRRDPLFSSNPLLVASAVCDILASSERPWYVVLDDVNDPADLVGLSLPSGAAGSTFITSRWSLSGWPTTYAAVPVGPFTPREAADFLQLRLSPSIRASLLPPDALARSADLAQALDLQPFSLDQAAITMLRESLSCAEYLRRIKERSHQTDGVPPDERNAAANWLEGLARTSYRPPAGLEERLVMLAALCGPTVPVSLFMTTPALRFLGSESLTEDDARRAAIRLSTRGLLAFGYSRLADPASYLEHGTVWIHDIAKRAILASRPDEILPAATVAAKALLDLWGEVERNPGQNAQLRICAQALVDNAPETVWNEAEAKKHVSEFVIRSLNNLAEVGQYALTADRYTELAQEATHRFGLTHPATLELRGRAAVWRSRAGDTSLAVQLLESVVGDYTAETATGVELKHLRLFREELAANYGWSGDPDRSIAAFDEVIAEWESDPSAEESLLRCQYGRALWLGRAGKPRAAWEELERLLPLRLRRLDPGRLGILRTRLQIEIWRSRTGLAENLPELRQEAITNLSQLVADWIDTAGQDHPDTLRARRHLAVLRTSNGDARALAELDEVQQASLTLFGPSHPDTLRSTKEVALAHGRLGDWSRALDILTVLVQTAVETVPTPEMLRIRYDLGCTLAELDRKPEAVRELKKILRIQQDTLSSSHPDLTDTRRMLDEQAKR